MHSLQQVHQAQWNYLQDLDSVQCNSVNTLVTDALDMDTTEQHAGSRHSNSHGSSKQAGCQWPLSNLPITALQQSLHHRCKVQVAVQAGQACRRRAVQRAHLQRVLVHVCTPEGSGQVVHCLGLEVAGVGQMGAVAQVHHGATPMTAPSDSSCFTSNACQ